jgi:hypothetical protein
MEGPLVQIVGWVVTVHSWLPLVNKFALTLRTLLEERSDRGPRSFPMMCRLIQWHHQQSNMEYIWNFIATFCTDAIIFIKRKVTNFKFLPTKNDPPLNLNIVKPSFAIAGSRSTFGFQGIGIPETV